jgi:hypothetical protein
MTIEQTLFKFIQDEYLHNLETLFKINLKL